MIRSMALVGLGAALGANARYLLSLWTSQRLGLDFPYATLGINISGSLLLGLAYTLIPAGPEPRLALLRAFVGVGVLGGYTTFSSFSYELYQLAARGSLGPATLYLAGSLGGSLLGTLAGIALGSVLTSS